MSKQPLDPSNIVVVVGALPSPPRVRTLPSGDELLEFDVTTRGPSGAMSVPVSWFAAPADHGLAVGSCVAVAGSVRRRFFRAGGSTQSRTEIVAARVVDATKRAALGRLTADVARAVGDAAVRSPTDRPVSVAVG